MAWSHHGVWSVLRLLYRAHQEGKPLDISSTEAGSISWHLGHPSPPWTPLEGCQCHSLNRQSKMAIFLTQSDNNTAKNADPGPMDTFAPVKGSAQWGDVPFSRAGSRSKQIPSLSGHHPLGFAPALCVHPLWPTSYDILQVPLVLRWLLTAGVLWACP